MEKKPHELALNDYILGMPYKDIAEKYKVGVDTVKKWKTRYGWNRDSIPKKKKIVSTLSTKNKKVDKRGQETKTEQEPEKELSDQESLFCYHYVRTWNAMQSAMMAGYSQNKMAAKVQGCVMLKRPHIRKEVDRLAELFRQDIHVDIQDFLSFCMKIIGADVGDFLKFGQKEVPVIGMYGPIEVTDEDTGKKSKLMQTINYIDLRESEELDTSVIQEVKQGKDGISIKLADKKWAWDQLIKYFDWLPDKWQRTIEERKVAVTEKNSGINEKGEEPVQIVDDIGSDEDETD